MIQRTTDLGAGVGHGLGYLASHHATYAGQPEDRVQAACVCEKQALLDQVDLLLSQ